MKNEAIRNKVYDSFCQLVREAKHLTSSERQELIRNLNLIPITKRDISSNEIKEWCSVHSHSDKYHGAIGGHITKIEVPTSIETFISYHCHSCGEEAMVESEGFAAFAELVKRAKEKKKKQSENIPVKE